MAMDETGNRVGNLRISFMVHDLMGYWMAISFNTPLDNLHLGCCCGQHHYAMAFNPGKSFTEHAGISSRA